MQQVRVSRASHVPVPPESTTPFNISREMRQQMRVVRHRAFERHQENAQWTKELLDCNKIQSDKISDGPMPSFNELHKNLSAAQKILAALDAANDAAALNECVEMVNAEKKQLSSGKQRKMEIVQL
ncbi:uncharacterized protein PHALS_01763 [Plasmopara halstedii]|uniref:Uncharacterized protein n=1 Tax=Plasmopara halstedii TaxID=4781 RepID=A0A0P1AWC9_PLAHL|nr:uncharacterized protein PHALS_01763 [Plasmopara halstedii]CEG45471.1 hypothetical protein PHALS_01763 [Plasmopara halstedii]|eukprot:XP_024581840.1 hypothetical protein PHALS_01763 [Plasmopara halstedii]